MVHQSELTAAVRETYWGDREHSFRRQLTRLEKSIVWADQFGRHGATDRDARVFTVTDSATGQAVVIDLSDHDG
ncbi:hypothetical protein [Streptomyces sp. NPDC093149]|uniref:hypothetical protein n=1 Tax=Streptomyces sp. NPDC093149 TaxID=3366031 RepID=UPI0038074D25